MRRMSKNTSSPLDVTIALTVEDAFIEGGPVNPIFQILPQPKGHEMRIPPKSNQAQIKITSSQPRGENFPKSLSKLVGAISWRRDVDIDSSSNEHIFKRPQDEMPNLGRIGHEENPLSTLATLFPLFLVVLSLRRGKKLQSYFFKEDYTYHTSNSKAFCQEEMEKMSH